MSVNLLGSWRTVRAVLPHIIEARGYILFVSSLSGTIQGPLHAVYNSSKAGLQAFANTLRLEVQGLGVDVGVTHNIYTATQTGREAVEPQMVITLRPRSGLPMTIHATESAGGSIPEEVSMATFVLVHGAWFGGWCWQKVIPLLKAAGHEVYAPTLTGLAERASELSPDIGLETHIQDVVGLLVEKNLRDVILVGHSYGGIVITGVVDQVPERIAHLVYLDTFVPRDGESMADISPLVIGLLRKQAQAHGNGYRVNPHGTYGVTREPERSWVRESVTPQPLKTFEQPLHLKNPAIVSEKPRTHIYCIGGSFFYSFMQQIVGRRALPPKEDGWRLRQLPTGHCAMITMPRELTDLLLEVV